MKVTINDKVQDIKTLWRENGKVKMIDQRLLPHKFEILTLNNHKETAQAIKSMATRGAGAIGCAAGFAMAQAALEAQEMVAKDFMEYIKRASDTIKKTRPTAVNLFKAVDRCLLAAEEGIIQNRIHKILEEADNIALEDLQASLAIGKYGASLIMNNYKILTHCNAGALAFTDHGTALSPIRYAFSQGKKLFVWIDETRPRCQGSRLTSWEMQQEGIPYAVIVDNAAGYYMRKGDVDIIIVGADRIAANGDVANKIGTYEKAVLAKENNIPFYVASPSMTFDLQTSSGDEIEIEERSAEEVIGMWGINDKGTQMRIKITKAGTNTHNPAFDITPSRYISGFITEKGILKPPFGKSILLNFKE